MFAGHGKPVSLLQWHPIANNVLASVGKDPSIKIWDVEKSSAVVTLEGFGGLVQDLAFNNDGSQLITSSKDKQAKIFDVRSATVAHDKWEPHEGGKAFKALFLGDRGQILTVGFTKQSKREFKVWDIKNLKDALNAVEVDQAAGVMMPFYDDDTRMLYLTGKGDGNIRYYEFVDEAPFV
jgi:coronin-1B/1C/6